MTLRGKVMAIGGAPLGKAEVTLRQLMQGGPPRHYVAHTAADGLFTFVDVEPGQYALNAERSGYVPAAYGSVNPMQGWTPLTVAPDRDLGELEFTLTPQAVITGRVFDADGDPFPGVRVLLVDAKNLRPRSGRIEQSNDEGEFRIAGVAPGRYFLQAAVD